MVRRSNGEGTIRHRSDGAWEMSVRIAGHRHWVRGKTQAEVRAKLTDLQRQHHVGTLAAPSRLTLGQFLDQWLDAGAADWKPKTLYGYQNIVANYWRPALGHVPLQKLTPAMVAAQYTRWRAVRSGGTLLNVHRCLHRALSVALRWGLVSRNVAKVLEPPRAQRRTPELWSREQASAFLVATQGDRYHALWSLLLGTGCRLGEALALRWSDTDLDLGRIKIARSLGWAGGTLVEGTPKTQSGVRVLSLPSFVSAALRDWRATQAGEYAAKGRAWTHDIRVVCSRNGTPPTARRCKTAFERACQQAGVPVIRRHDCRHLAASILLAEGVPLPAVSQRLGHSSPAITAAVYSHALKGSDEQSAQALDKALGTREQMGQEPPGAPLPS
jgi:integrase